MKERVICAVLVVMAGCDDHAKPRSLKDQPSVFRQKIDAPDSRFAVAGSKDGMTASGPGSSFGTAAVPASAVRAAEVAPEKLAATGDLLSELKARETPDHSIMIELPADILFDFDKDSLRPDAAVPLSKAATLIASYSDAPLAVNGYTDNKGSDAYNDPLSERRARTVADWLKRSTGRTPDVAGFGKRKPVVPNTKADGPMIRMAASVTGGSKS